MSLEPKLVQQTSQKLLLSPQMKLYLQLLSLPVLDLKTLVENEMVENPSLEEDLTENTSIESLSKENTELSTAEEQTLEFLAQETSDGPSGRDPNEAKTLQKKIDYKQSLLTNTTTLNDYLVWQLRFLNLNEEENEIAKTLIGNVNEDGFLAVEIQEVAIQLKKNVDTVEKILKLLQTFDPSGVCARNLQETLLIQLSRLSQENNEVKIAQDIVKNHFEDLYRKHFDIISKKLHVNLEKIHKAFEIIGKLDPKPGRIFNAGQSTVIIPDAIIAYDENEAIKYKVEILNDFLPKLRISAEFKKILKDQKADAETKQYVKAKLKSAMWLLQAIQQRQSTLERITQAIVKAQTEFLEKGFAFLKPLRMKDIADAIGIHESTVSRAISGKYVQTPQGTIPIKSFFSTKLETHSGVPESQKSIMERIKSIVENENSAKPLTDIQITEALKNEGIKVARRTVAKYREEMKILPGHLRKK